MSTFPFDSVIEKMPANQKKSEKQKKHKIGKITHRQTLHRQHFYTVVNRKKHAQHDKEQK